MVQSRLAAGWPGLSVRNTQRYSAVLREGGLSRQWLGVSGHVVIVTRGVGLQEFFNFDIRFCDEYTIFREFVDF